MIGVNDDGALVCSAPPEGGAVDWADLAGVPGGFADSVDGDALGLLACMSGQFVRWSGSAWECAAAPGEGHVHLFTTLSYSDYVEDVTPVSALELLETVGTFDKQQVESIVLLHWTGTGFRDGTLDTQHCAYQLRIDGRDDTGSSGTALGGGALAIQYGENDSHSVVGHFAWPGVGVHTVEIWSRGTADVCAVNGGGFDQFVLVEEIG